MGRGENVYRTSGASSVGSLPYQINILRTRRVSQFDLRTRKALHLTHRKPLIYKGGCRVKPCLVQLSEVLDGADHLRGVAVLARHRFGRCRRGEK